MSVTLLFTDIEGSTRLVQQLGDAYLAALEEHRRTVRNALAATGGVEVDCRGDEFMATFTQPDAAVAAALAIQEGERGVVRVRVGIHTGEPLRVEGGYVGVDVHRAARICAAGHGGQVLLSETTCGSLRAGVTVRDLGVHQLRGLDQPERIYQLNGRDFPPLRADIADHGLGTRIRVVLADDSVLLREGVARLLAEAGFEVVGQSGTADDLLLKVRSYNLTSRSSTSGCRRRTPTRVCALPTRSGCASRRLGCSYSHSTSRRVTRSSCSRAVPKAWGICSRIVSPT